MSAEPDPVPEEGAEDQPKGELAHLDPENHYVTLESGTEVEIVRLKARQFFRMLRIVTRGGINVLPAIELRPGMDPEEFITKLSALLIFAIPESEDETIDFIQSMTLPVVPVGASAAEIKEASDRLYSPPGPDGPDSAGELWNPEMEDMISIIERIVQVEGRDLLALGKRLQGLLSVAEATGQLRNPRTTTAKAKQNGGTRKARSLVGGRQRST